MEDIDIKKLLMALKNAEEHKEGGEEEDEDDDSGSVEIISSVEEDEPPPPTRAKETTKFRDNKAAAAEEDGKSQADSKIPEIPAQFQSRDSQEAFYARCSSSARGRYGGRGAAMEGPAQAGADDDDDEDLEIDGVRWKDFTKEEDEYETIEGQ